MVEVFVNLVDPVNKLTDLGFSCLVKATVKVSFLVLEPFRRRGMRNQIFNN